jgi:hypothetical protein
MAKAFAVRRSPFAGPGNYAGLLSLRDIPSGNAERLLLSTVSSARLKIPWERLFLAKVSEP